MGDRHHVLVEQAVEASGDSLLHDHGVGTQLQVSFQGQAALVGAGQAPRLGVDVEGLVLEGPRRRHLLGLGSTPPGGVLLLILFGTGVERLDEEDPLEGVHGDHHPDQRVSLGVPEAHVVALVLLTEEPVLVGVHRLAVKEVEDDLGQVLGDSGIGVLLLTVARGSSEGHVLDRHQGNQYVAGVLAGSQAHRQAGALQAYGVGISFELFAVQEMD